ncbi:MAG TPA: hypothetical protein VGV92_05660 [Gammaproteobacteria bacterium]|nr:hypothetical protein [Gammaproteobacteria bacterium]
MAFYIVINKLSEGDEFAYYEYGDSGKKFGKLKISKLTGDVALIELAESDEQELKAERASWSLIKHWKKGEYPDKTFWAS